MLTRAALAAVSLFALGASALRHPIEYYEEKFVDWMQAHNVSFLDGSIFVERLRVWADNDDYIRQVNDRGLPYKLAHNRFSHLTLDEFHRHYRLGRHRGYESFNAMTKEDALFTHTHSGNRLRSSALPTQVDWVDQGIVTPVKDQGMCGSCWAFSTTGALEGAYALKENSLVSFSEQQLVDCDNTDAHCEGGLMDQAFSWIKRNGGLTSEQAYPYEGVEEACHKATPVPGSAVKGFVDVAQEEDALVSAIALTPVSVAIEADQRDFQLYSEGVFTGLCGTNLDHGVLAVGFGTLDGNDFYKVKNSWGPGWGDNGYIYIQRNKGQRGGQCGILMAASYPVL